MDKRSFPRYHILPLNAYIMIEGERVWVKDISLGGLQLFHTQKLHIKENQEITFYLGQKIIRKLIINEVWSRESINNSHISQTPNLTNLYGISLCFEKYIDFKNWHTLIHATHKYKLKT